MNLVKILIYLNRKGKVTKNEALEMWRKESIRLGQKRWSKNTLRK